MVVLVLRTVFNQIHHPTIIGFVIKFLHCPVNKGNGIREVIVDSLRIEANCGVRCSSNQTSGI